VIPCEIPKIKHWEIETKIKGCTIEPATVTVVYSQMYPGWDTRIMMAMEEALARICGMYPKEIFDMDNTFQQFGRRNHEGWALSTPGRREGLPWTEIQLEDMETYAFNMETMLHNEMDATDNAKYQLREKEEKIDQLENTIQKLKEKNVLLEAINDKLKAKIEDQTAQNIGLQGQCAYLSKYLMKYEPWPTKKKTLRATEEETPEAPKNDHQELVVSEANEEETPVEKDGEEPIGMRVKRRRTGNTRAYLTQFK
jgi:myosin heavy subunit